MTEIGWVDEKDTRPSFFKLNSNSFLNEELKTARDTIRDNAIRIQPQIESRPAVENWKRIHELYQDQPWMITTEAAIESPTIEEELSKIHEELATIRQERKADKKDALAIKEENEQLKKENTKLKSQLKKARAKTKSKEETIDVLQIQLEDQQTQIDKLELRMNDVETDYSVKSEFK